MLYIAGKAQNTTWVISFNSPHQLETAAALRLTLSRAYCGSFRPDARPLVTADEVDQIVRSKNRGQLMERTFDGVLGMFDRKIRVSSSANACAPLFMTPNIDFKAQYVQCFVGTIKAQEGLLVWWNSRQTLPTGTGSGSCCHDVHTCHIPLAVRTGLQNVQLDSRRLLLPSLLIRCVHLLRLCTVMQELLSLQNWQFSVQHTSKVWL